jgi:cardiolipin synthase
MSAEAAAKLLLTLVSAVAAVWASSHALLNKRDPRATWGWIVLCWLFPLGGALIYTLLGVNRLETRAQRLRPPAMRRPSRELHPADLRLCNGRQQRLAPLIDLVELVRTADVLTELPLLAGNHLQPLHNGEQAYPRMLQAIDAAQDSLLLATYIFDTDAVGQRFIDALARAHERGVRVRVLLDGYADWLNGWRRASHLLAARGVPVARFHPPRLIPPSLHLNLRNHRKLLLIDGELAFTGGMNIGSRHMALALDNPRREYDLHFELQGPVVEQLTAVFDEDWRYVTGEPPLSAPARAPRGAGDSACRVITDGPNEDIGRLTLVLLAALAGAHRSVQIMTPYFLPPRELIGALQSAALRGVAVEVILPGVSDQRAVKWATQHLLWELVGRGVKVFYRPAPFAHTKLLMVDGYYAQIGSANLDPRSLRLNFELVVELFDTALIGGLQQHFEAVRAEAEEVTLRQLQARRLPTRLRDAFCWLFSPYL